jgi:hypothetical protein
VADGTGKAEGRLTRSRRDRTRETKLTNAGQLQGTKETAVLSEQGRLVAVARRLRGAVGAALLASTLGCGSRPHQTIGLTNGDSGRTVVAEVGDRIEATLQTIGPGRYGTPILSANSIEFLGEFAAGAPNPGGARQLYRFEAVSAGRTDIAIPHGGDPPNGPADPGFAITVKCRDRAVVMKGCGTARVRLA